MRTSLLLVCPKDTAERLAIQLQESCFCVDGTCTAASLSEAAAAMEQAESVGALLCDIDAFPNWKTLYALARSQAPDMPFLVCSPSGDLARVTEAMDLGADDCLLKPMTPEALFRAFQKNTTLNGETARQTSLFWQWISPIVLERFFSDLLTRRIPSNPEHLEQMLSSLKHPELAAIQFTPVLLSFELHRAYSPNAEYLLSNYADALLLSGEQPGIRVQIDYHRTCFLLFCSQTSTAALVQRGRKVIETGNVSAGSCANLCIGEPCGISDLPGMYDRLRQHAQRLSLEKRVNVCCPLPASIDAPSADNGKFAAWAMMLDSGLLKETEVQILDELAIMERRGGLSAVARVHFIEEILTLCVHLLRERQISETSVFHNSTLKALFPTAGDSWNQTEQYISALLQVVFDAMFPSLPEASLSSRVKAYIDANPFKKMTRESIASNVHANKDYLARVFKSTEGISISDYIMKKRLIAAKQMLAATSLSITTISEELGFSNPSHFCSVFKREFGLPPALYRRQAKEE